MTFTTTTHTPKFIVAALLLALILLTLDPIGHHHLRMKPKKALSHHQHYSNFTKHNMGVITIVHKPTNTTLPFGQFEPDSSFPIC